MINRGIHLALSPGYLVKSMDEGYVYNCLWCIKRVGKHDTKTHLYLSHKRETFICHRCKIGGGFKKLAQLLKLEFISDKPLSGWDKSIAEFYGKHEEINYDPEVLEFPDSFKKVKNGVAGYPYLRFDRGLSDNKINFYKFYSDERVARVVAPVFMRGDLVYWVSRQFVTEGWLSKAAKYKNCPVSRVNILFNYDRARLHEDIFIAEGVFSSIACGENAVATFGKYITNGQYQLLAGMKRVKRFYFALDGDAIDVSVQSARILNDMGKESYVVMFPYNDDPDDYLRRNPGFDLRDISIRYSRDAEMEILLSTT